MSFTKIVLIKKNEPNIEFTGKEVARANDITIFETNKNNWVCSLEDFYGNSVMHYIINNKNANELYDLLGNTEKAKKIYQKLNLNFNSILDI